MAQLNLAGRRAAAAAVICFEWLQRPENVLAGVLRWPDYRSKQWPNAIKILHHKTGATVWHPLEDTVNDVTVKSSTPSVTRSCRRRALRISGVTEEGPFGPALNSASRMLRGL